MATATLTSMIINLSQSLPAVEAMMKGLAYIIGLVFFMVSIHKVRAHLGRGGGSSRESSFVPLAYFMGGTAFFFFPSVVDILSNSAFGQNNVLEYVRFKPNYVNAIKVLIQAAGIIWFIRGCVLLVHASEPGVQHGPKGMVFLIAGIGAINLDDTLGILNFMMDSLEKMSGMAPKN
jgi:hypothetical protein